MLKTFQRIWSPKILYFFNCLNKSGKWCEGFNKGTIHWGDARQKIYEIEDSLSFDLILLDPVDYFQPLHPHFYFHLIHHLIHHYHHLIHHLIHHYYHHLIHHYLHLLQHDDDQLFIYV